MSRLEFHFVWNRFYCFGLGFDYYTMSEYEYDEVVARVLRLDFLLFSLNFTWWTSSWRRAEWS